MLGASNMPRAEISPASRKRLLTDLKRLEEEPIPLASASPCSESDLTLWNGVIGAELDVTHFGRITVPLHFLIDFPSDYPNSAPNIGFSFQFRYQGGAEYVMPDGRLKGKKVICLDILGNFGGVHTEWKTEVGSGWSPAYTVTTLLIQLQSVLCDLGSAMSQKERDVTYQSAMRFCEQNPDAVIPLMDEDDIRDRREERLVEKKLMKICSGNEDLVGRVSLFARRTGIAQKEAEMSILLTLLGDVRAQQVDHMLAVRVIQRLKWWLMETFVAGAQVNFTQKLCLVLGSVVKSATFLPLLSSYPGKHTTKVSAKTPTNPPLSSSCLCGSTRLMLPLGQNGAKSC